MEMSTGMTPNSYSVISHWACNFGQNCWEWSFLQPSHRISFEILYTRLFSLSNFYPESFYLAKWKGLFNMVFDSLSVFVENQLFDSIKLLEKISSNLNQHHQTKHSLPGAWSPQYFPQNAITLIHFEFSKLRGVLLKRRMLQLPSQIEKGRHSSRHSRLF